MSGEIKRMIDAIVSSRSKGNPTIAKAVETKLILKGIDPQNYTSASPDNPAVISKLKEMAKQFNVTV